MSYVLHVSEGAGNEPRFVILFSVVELSSVTSQMYIPQK